MSKIFEYFYLFNVLKNKLEEERKIILQEKLLLNKLKLKVLFYNKDIFIFN